jgi:hypothetical protein
VFLLFPRNIGLHYTEIIILDTVGYAQCYQPWLLVLADKENCGNQLSNRTCLLWLPTALNSKHFRNKVYTLQPFVMCDAVLEVTAFVKLLVHSSETIV